jgi:hypothetical protein
MDNLPVFFTVDDFCKLFEPIWQTQRNPCNNLRFFPPPPASVTAKAACG